MNTHRLSTAIARALASASLFALLGGIVPAQAAGQRGEAAATAIKPDGVDSLAPQRAEGDWTCPMHAEIHRHAPGKCPVCKMNLVKAKPGKG